MAGQGLFLPGGPLRKRLGHGDASIFAIPCYQDAHPTQSSTTSAFEIERADARPDMMGAKAGCSTADSKSAIDAGAIAMHSTEAE